MAGVDVTVTKLLSPLKTAVIECVPPPNVLSGKEAVLVFAPLAVKVTVPKAVLPSKKVTVPLGKPKEVGELTVLVNVTISL